MASTTADVVPTVIQSSDMGDVVWPDGVFCGSVEEAASSGGSIIRKAIDAVSASGGVAAPSGASKTGATGLMARISGFKHPFAFTSDAELSTVPVGDSRCITTSERRYRSARLQCSGERSAASSTLSPKDAQLRAKRALRPPDCKGRPRAGPGLRIFRHPEPHRVRPCDDPLLYAALQRQHRIDGRAHTGNGGEAHPQAKLSRRRLPARCHAAPAKVGPRYIDEQARLIEPYLAPAQITAIVLNVHQGDTLNWALHREGRTKVTAPVSQAGELIQLQPYGSSRPGRIVAKRSANTAR
uniref:Uncharacterized protein n=1 Tax=Anopheles coluzzii TaxID=1518534 RepID=A0A8W7Q1C0_ANOCL